MESLGVLLLHPMDAYLEQELARRCRLLRFCWDAPPDRRDAFLRAHAGSVRAVVTGGVAGAGAALIDALPRLEIVACFSVGFDRVDLARCRERGVRVTNTPGVLTDDVADLAVGLAIAVLRRIPQADGYVRAGQWKAKGDFTLTTRAELEEEKRRREELEAQLQAIRSEQAARDAEARRREAEARAREQDFYAYMRDQFAALGHNLAPLPPWAPPPPAISPPLPPSAASNDAPHDPSLCRNLFPPSQ